MVGLAQVFDSIYRQNVWGREGNGSGPGSSRKNTAGVRKIIHTIISWLGVQSIIDAPCGSREWQIPLVDEIRIYSPSFVYLGLDISSEALSRNPHSNLATQMHDLVTDPLPSGYDIVLSRDALQHNTQHDVFKILCHFAQSDARYFLIGSYPNSTENKNISSGDYFKIDLKKPPYSLIPWYIFDEHYDGKYLYLYNRSQLQISKFCSI